ncbi:MAG: F0F1 ATP synthase subunit delta [Alcanivoracaceae bacterium]|jgi:F-type H+-transporting ATPase subunit delta|nr:F0F1 ATP synthase subunit delta [Alcanivoracaceae bacterium]
MAELTTIARPYAKAAFLYASANNALDSWEQSLGLLAALVEEPQLAAALDSPGLTSTQRAELVAQVCGDQLDEPGSNLVAQLAQHNRLPLLPTIFRLFHELKAAQQNVADVEVISAFELDDAETSKLVAALEKRFGKEVQVRKAVDESLIGGVLVRAGDTVIDSSVRGRLQKLAEQLNSRV